MKKQLLKILGFSEKEITVYLSVLEEGSAKGALIAKKTGLNRTTVYDIVEGLIQKGLISKFKKGNTMFFHALDPRQLLTYLDREKQETISLIDRKKKNVEELLPELISLQDTASARPKIEFFEGEKGLREAYEDSLTCRGGMLAYTNVQTMFEALPNFFPQYFQRRVTKKIPIRAIFVQNPKSIERAELNQTELRETRFVPNPELIWTPEVKIYNDKVLIASWKEKVAVILESKEYADLQKIVFELLWSVLPKQP